MDRWIYKVIDIVEYLAHKISKLMVIAKKKKQKIMIQMPSIQKFNHNE